MDLPPRRNWPKCRHGLLKSKCTDCIKLRNHLRNAAYYRQNTEAEKARHRASYRALRARMFKVYGARCSCCGETEERFLTLEHVNNNGTEDRKRHKSAATMLAHLDRLGWPRVGYTVTCYNCNLGAAKNGGVCPHKIAFDSAEECC